MKYKGKDFLVWEAVADGDFSIVACSTDCSLEVSQELREVAPSQSSRAKEYVAGPYEWSITCDALIDASAAGFNSAMRFASRIIQGAKVSVSFGVGDPRGRDYAGYTGYALVQSVTKGAPLGSAATLSVTFKGTGPLVSVAAR